LLFSPYGKGFFLVLLGVVFKVLHVIKTSGSAPWSAPTEGYPATPEIAGVPAGGRPAPSPAAAPAFVAVFG
jgi:hypothetical protein